MSDQCQFCGDSPAQFVCATSGCSKRLCRQCDSKWHGHPDRLKHLRDQIDDSWICSYCTFENFAQTVGGGRLVCSMCFKTAAASADMPQANTLEAELPCPTCTLMNDSSLETCQLCDSSLRGEPRSLGSNNSARTHRTEMWQDPRTRALAARDARDSNWQNPWAKPVTASDARDSNWHESRARMMAEERQMLARVNRLHDEISGSRISGSEGYQCCCQGTSSASAGVKRK